MFCCARLRYLTRQNLYAYNSLNKEDKLRTRLRRFLCFGVFPSVRGFPVLLGFLVGVQIII